MYHTDRERVGGLGMWANVLRARPDAVLRRLHGSGLGGGPDVVHIRTSAQQHSFGAVAQFQKHITQLKLSWHRIPGNSRMIGIVFDPPEAQLSQDQVISTWLVASVSDPIDVLALSCNLESVYSVAYPAHESNTASLAPL